MFGLARGWIRPRTVRLLSGGSGDIRYFRKQDHQERRQERLREARIASGKPPIVTQTVKRVSDLNEFKTFHLQGTRDPPSPSKPKNRDAASRRPQKKPAPASTVDNPTPNITEVTLEAETPLDEFSRVTGASLSEVKDLLFRLGEDQSMETVPFDVAEILCDELGILARQKVDKSTLSLKERLSADEYAALPTRPPVVALIGHVDHGKTTLLDALRKTSVAAGEAGGITQHLGAFQVALPSGQRVTFLDTPGHADFRAMRARGVGVTDLVVLVVAADEGVKEQTIEVIQQARASKVPILVAITKMDKPGVDTADVSRQLASYDVLVEDMGGTVVCVPLSAKTGEGLSDLTEMLVLQAELLDLRGDPQAVAEGVVIESKQARGQGPTATVLVHTGTLRTGDWFLVGTHYGRVRALLNASRQRVPRASLSEAVEVVGCRGEPEVGSQLVVVKSESVAKALARERTAHQREAEVTQAQEIAAQRNSYDRLRRLLDRRAKLEEKKGRSRRAARLLAEEKFKRLDEMLANAESAAQARGEAGGNIPIASGFDQLNVVVKGDVAGTNEAMRDALHHLSARLAAEEDVSVPLRIVRHGVGPVTEGDVTFAAAANAAVLALGAQVSPAMLRLAKRHNVVVKHSQVIYHMLEQVEDRLRQLNEPDEQETLVGEASVQQLFPVSGKGKKVVAGCRMVSGAISRDEPVRIVRGKDVVFEGTVESLRHFKDEVEEVKDNQECGILVKDYVEVQRGDLIQAWQIVKNTSKSKWR